MKNFLTLVFVCIAFIGFAQQGIIGISVVSNGYELKITQFPKAPNLVYYDTKELEWKITCIQTGNKEITVTPLNGVLKYYFNGNVLIGCKIVYKKNGIVVGIQSIPSKCIFGLNPTACFQKL